MAGTSQMVWLENPPGFEVDGNLLCAFERGLDPAHPERSVIPARVLGYGEISTVFAIDAEGLRGLAFKRLPIFQTAEEMEAYRAIYTEYNRLLAEEVGIHIVPHGYAAFFSATGRPVFYIIQHQQPAESVGHKAMQLLPSQEVPRLFVQALRELRKVWLYNHRQEHIQIAVDGQISNWTIVGFDAEHVALGDEITLLYMDTSTPLFRVEGVEQLNPELFLRSAPSFLRWVLRLLFLEDVVNRYYDPHLVTVDLIANCYKEQRPDLIPALVQAANAFFTGEGADLGVQPVTEKEIADYYREDRLIWSLYLSMRRLDRFLHRHILRREYPYILPGRIKR